MEIVKYNVNEAQISKMADIYMNLTITDIDNKEEFESVHSARMTMTKHRTAVDKRRKSANKNAQEFIKTNNLNAKKLIELMSPVELHLKTEEKKVTDEEARRKEKAEREIQEKIEVRIKTLSKYGAVTFMEIACMTDEEFNIVLEEKITSHKAEQKRLADEEAARKAESERLEKMRLEQEAEAARLEKIILENEAIAKIEAAKLAAERAEIEQIREQQRKEAEAKEKALEDERKAIEDEKRIEKEKKEREIFEKEAAARSKLQAEADLAEKIKREAIEKIAREKAEQAEKKRKEDMKPDKEKLVLWANIISEIKCPDVKYKVTREIVTDVELKIGKIADDLMRKAEVM